MQMNSTPIAKMTQSGVNSWMAAITLLLASSQALAGAFCSVSSLGFSSAYVPGNLAMNITSASFDVTCTAGPKKSNVQYQIAVDNGMNALGTQNRSTLAGSFINYSLASDGACMNAWKGAADLPNPRAKLSLAANQTVTTTYTFFGCIPGGQAVLPPEGTYTDMVSMTFSTANASGGGASSFTGGSLPVNILSPASCSFTSPPTSMVFAYTSFSPVDVLANSAFAMRCTRLLPFSIDLDATAGTIVGLNYSLLLNTAAAGGTPTLASVGTGIVQSFYINGTIAAGQGGTCTSAFCSGTQTRTLTVTY
jgi:hypothetical protein